MGEILHVATFDIICSFKFATNCLDRNLPTPMGLWSPFFLDSHIFDVKSSCFRLTISHNAEGAITEHSELNLATRLWTRINSSLILNQKLSKYNKLAKIVMVQVLGTVEDERTFNNLSFMKNKF